MDGQAEGDLSVKVLCLTLDDQANVSADSFSSAPNSQYIKGAVEFLAFVEKAVSDQDSNRRSLQFEDLVFQKMDIDIGFGIA